MREVELVWTALNGPTGGSKRLFFSQSKTGQCIVRVSPTLTGVCIFTGSELSSEGLEVSGACGLVGVDMTNKALEVLGNGLELLGGASGTLGNRFRSLPVSTEFPTRLPPSS